MISCWFWKPVNLDLCTVGGQPVKCSKLHLDTMIVMSAQALPVSDMKQVGNHLTAPHQIKLHIEIFAPASLSLFTTEKNWLLQLVHIMTLCHLSFHSSWQLPSFYSMPSLSPKLCTHSPPSITSTISPNMIKNQNHMLEKQDNHLHSLGWFMLWSPSYWPQDWFNN